MHCIIIMDNEEMEEGKGDATPNRKQMQGREKVARQAHCPIHWQLPLTQMAMPPRHLVWQWEMEIQRKITDTTITRKLKPSPKQNHHTTIIHSKTNENIKTNLRNYGTVDEIPRAVGPHEGRRSVLANDHDDFESQAMGVVSA